MALKDKIERFALANAYSHGGKAQAGAVLGKVLSEDPKLRLKIKQIMPDIQRVIKSVNRLGVKEQEKKLRRVWPEFFAPKEKKAKVLPELALAKRGKVVMRFAPSPSGPLHIGHAYTLGLNSEYCRKYNGKLIIRIEDTNPLNVYEKAYELIPEDAKWVTKNNVWKVFIQSSRMAKYYKWASELLKRQRAYVCGCESEAWKKMMIKSVACPCRELEPEEQLKRWKAMLNGDIEEGKAVVRIKTDIWHKNPAMRDWPALRINEGKHPLVGKKYRVWPLMNFAVAIDDHDMGITHAIRMKEHRDNELRQKYIYDYLGWTMPVHVYVGAVNFKDFKLSTTKMKLAIKEKRYTGWDDVRLPTLLGLRRRGYLPEAFIKYSIEVGPTETDKTVTREELFDLINNFNKEVLDPVANRFFFVPNAVKISVEGAPKLKEVSVKVHPEKTVKRKIKVGKDFWISGDDFKKLKGKEIRLLDLFNVKLGKRAKFTSKPNKDIPKIQWVSDGAVKAYVLMPNGKMIKGLAEENIKKLKARDIIQFVRVGFCRKDSEKIFCFAHM